MLLASVTFLLGGSVEAQQALQSVISATLPNGRLITPAGKWVGVAPYPFALALNTDGSQLVVPSIGWPFSLNVIDHPESSSSILTKLPTRVTRLPPGKKNDPEVQVLTGVVYSPDGKLLYDSTGDTGAVDFYTTADWKRVGRVSLNGLVNGATFAESFAAALVLSPDGRTLYVIDQANWRVVAIDTARRQLVGSIPTGANPFGLALSPDGRRLYCTNSGLFEYKPVAGVVQAPDNPEKLLASGLKFPPFGYPSAAARDGAIAEGHAVPGLGPENSPRGSSLWTYAVDDSHTPKLLAKLRLGETISADAKDAVGGAAPMGVIADKDRVYVALAHQDSVAVVNAEGTTLLHEIPLTPFTGPRFQDSKGRPLRGVMPAGLAVQEHRLYVTEAGINAVAIIDTRSARLLGHVPVGWFPTAAAVSPDGRTLYVVNTKGKGSGANAGPGYDAAKSGSYIGELEFGSLSMIPLDAIATEAALRQMTAKVVANNTAALGSAAESVPRLKHVFLIIRENRTFDEILGDLPGADGAPALTRWGMHGWLAAKPLDKTYQVTPNAHALAGRFATSDRFFVDSDVSSDGHRWVVAAAETPWFHVAWTSHYGGRRTENAGSAAPGRRALGGGNDGPMPEDEPEFGTLWEHVSNAGLSIRNYGEGLELAGSEEIDGSAPQGQRLVLNAPVPQPVFTSSDRNFATFNLGIPDQLRAAEFARDFSQVLAGPAVPALIVIRLPGDHTADPRPTDGYPDRASYVADNDLALGRIVDLISHSKAWPESAILVTEDDAQGGVDHVDAHRSVMLAISPYIRPGTVSHRHSSMGSLQKTAYQLLGIGPLNLEDALAGNLGDMFQAAPDLTPFNAVPSDPRVFDAATAKIARPKNAKEARALVDCDDADDIRRQFHPVSGHKRKARRKDDDD